jgi:hypothetical protein
MALSPANPMTKVLNTWPSFANETLQRYRSLVRPLLMLPFLVAGKECHG